MANISCDNDSKSTSLWGFNEHINLILLSMFVIVVATILCVKCCSSCCNKAQEAKAETTDLQNEAVNDSTLTQQ